MDASSVFVIAILLFCAHLSSQMLNEDDVKITSAITEDATPAQVTVQNTTAHKNCTTATGLLGNCILRNYCNYGTHAIDVTLYGRKGYIQPCKLDEACCPIDSQHQVVSTYNNTQTDKDFEFDNDS